jgi:hypothetical protein
MTLFISNPSKQQVEFHFRRAVTRDTSGPQCVVIQSGCQVPVGHGWPREEIAYIIQQLENQGGANAAVAHGRMGKFTGLLYRDDQPVDEDEIVTAHDAIVTDQEERSVQQTTRSALAFDRSANRNNKNGRGGKDRLARVTQVEVIQELEPHQRLTGEEIRFSLSVDPDAHADAKISI